MVSISWSRERRKLILRNYFPLTVFTKRFIVHVWHRRCLSKLGFWICQSFQYTRVSNTPGFWMCFLFWISQGFGYATTLNVPDLHSFLNTLDYAWMCLTLSVIPYLKECNSLSKGIIDRFLEKWKFDFLIVVGGIWFCLLFQIKYFYK